MKWLDAAGVEGVDLTRGAVFDQVSLAMDAAISGQGVALSRSVLAAADILAGRLVRPFGPDLGVAYAYYIVCPKPTAERPKIRVFRDWLLAEAKADAEAIEALGG